MASVVTELMGVLLPGGLAVAVVMGVQAVRSWRDGRASREETVIERLQRQLSESDVRIDNAENDEAHAITLANYWRQRAADLEFEMRRQGVAVPERSPMPEKRKVLSRAKTRSQKRLVRQRPAVDEIEE